MNLLDREIGGNGRIDIKIWSYLTKLFVQSTFTACSEDLFRKAKLKLKEKVQEIKEQIRREMKKRRKDLRLFSF